MPGREFFAFLVVGNLAIWLLRSMVNAKGLNIQTADNFYGRVPWLLIMNINYPLLLFFRFHSSVCFAAVWHTAYIPLHTKLRAKTSGIAKCNDGYNTADTVGLHKIALSLSDIPEANESVTKHIPEHSVCSADTAVYGSH